MTSWHADRFRGWAGLLAVLVALIVVSAKSLIRASGDELRTGWVLLARIVILQLRAPGVEEGFVTVESLGPPAGTRGRCGLGDERLEALLRRIATSDVLVVLEVGPETSKALVASTDLSGVFDLTHTEDRASKNETNDAHHDHHFKKAETTGHTRAWTIVFSRLNFHCFDKKTLH